MIVRIVTMTFLPEKVSKFLSLFETVKSSILQFPGCNSVELVQQVDNYNVISTLSRWNTVEELNQYRESDFFKSTWNQTKMWFSEKPIAQSHQLINE